MDKIIKKLQKEINSIFASEFISGTIYLSVPIELKIQGNYKEHADALLKIESEVKSPIGVNQKGNYYWNKNIEVYISVVSPK